MLLSVSDVSEQARITSQSAGSPFRFETKYCKPASLGPTGTITLIGQFNSNLAIRTAIPIAPDSTPHQVSAQPYPMRVYSPHQFPQLVFP